MRKEAFFGMSHEESLDLLSQARVVHLATTTPVRQPVLRASNAVVMENAVFFHGSGAGEKGTTVGMPAVVSAEVVVAEIPSFMIDADHACVATTFYRSVQAHGHLEAVKDPAEKARVLRAFMAKYQPEGGFQPVEHQSPLYQKAIEELLVLRMPIEHLDGKAKLGQNREPAELTRVLEKLWARGLPGDPRAIEVIRAANPALPAPGFLSWPGGLPLTCALGGEPADLAQTVKLLEGEYWLAGLQPEQIARAHELAQAWVGARDEGLVIASARAVSDGKTAWIYDVVVDRPWRGRGLGTALMHLILDHPAVRTAASVRLRTKDAQPLYARFGFRDASEVERSFPSSEMVLERAGG
ncbi:MAG TPA: GNAT family N-acetyltransferase [Anaeromyxobacteraceae bacterium]|jgi:nitroimidazol reductase NimA-like FMN-containing flavoprotein (pyridoxamine 5'-phosphate oxidase superfamily)/GNAT superfamily N-acetyltransferase|nr:GNAT family N-acetyltransferase [Anaeromyxobacteraceae bacterium]